LLKKDVAWTWNEEAQEAFNTLKEKLSGFPILRRPNFNKVFILHVDWSALGIGVILGQLDEEGKEYVIAYASRATTRLRTTILHMKGSVLLLYGLSYILGLIFMTPSSLCIPTSSLSSG
jgi:DNA mismatch repair protein MutH